MRKGFKVLILSLVFAILVTSAYQQFLPMLSTEYKGTSPVNTELTEQNKVDFSLNVDFNKKFHNGEKNFCFREHKILNKLSKVSRNLTKCIKEDLPKFFNDLQAISEALAKKDQSEIDRLTQELEKDAEIIQIDCALRTPRIFYNEHFKTHFPKIDDIIDCLEASKPLVANLEVIYNDIKIKNFDDLVDHIPTTYYAAKATYDVCKKLFEHDKEELSYLENFSIENNEETNNNFNKIIEESVVDANKVYEELVSMKKYFINKEFKSLFSQLNQFISEANVFGNKYENQITIEKFNKFTSLNNEENKLSVSKKCLVDLALLAKDSATLGKAVAAQNIIVIVALIPRIVKEVKAVEVDCKNN